MLKKTLTAVAIATLAFTAQAADVLKVAATAVPHAEILNFNKPQLKAAGIELQVKEFSDYVQPNAAVQDKQLDANFFQHDPYLQNFMEEHKEVKLVSAGGIHTCTGGINARDRTRIRRGSAVQFRNAGVRAAIAGTGAARKPPSFGGGNGLCFN